MLRVLIRPQERDAEKKTLSARPVQQQGCGILFPSMQLQIELRVPCPALSCPALPSAPGRRAVLHHMVAPFSRRYIWQSPSVVKAGVIIFLRST